MVVLKFRRFLLFSLSLLMVGTAGLIIYGETRRDAPTFTGRLLDLLPAEDQVPGWRRELRPIAETPEMKQRVTETLNYDDAVYAVYTRGNERISFYMTYWQPGKMSHRLVAGHTPDVCWIGAGWTCTYARTNLDITVAGTRLFPVQERHMVLHEASETVLFWHLVRGETVSYGPMPPPWYSFFLDMWHFGLRQRHEQFFIRFSSGTGNLEWWSSEPVQAIARRLRMLHVPSGS